MDRHLCIVYIILAGVLVLLCDALSFGRPPRYNNTKTVNRSIAIIGNDFMLDGEPLHIVSGSMHYFRLPAAYWRDRLRKLKAAGLNAVSTYVEWSYHEPEERQYRFEGDYAVAKFIRVAGEEGLLVLLRPGPYICAERDLGGLPYWLLGKYPNIHLRTTDKNFIKETAMWFAKLLKHLTPFLYGNGGPIILVQVKNEYGTYGSDMEYRKKIRDLISQHVGTNAVLYTTDGPHEFTKGSVPGALTTIDFGHNVDAAEAFKSLRQYMPHGPLMNSEFYTGWLTHWGEPFQTVEIDHVIKKLRIMLQLRINVNFYMFFGGTNFEFHSGANYFGDTYKPHITSYDYDSPLTEAGDPTPKYYAIRSLLREYNFETNDIPELSPSKKGSYGPVKVTPRISLLTNEGRSVMGKKYQNVTGPILPCFEELTQRSGLVLFETILPKRSGVLSIQKPRDWIYVYVDGEFKGSLSRMYKNTSLHIHSKDNSVLSLLVENQGRVNYGEGIHDRKGILSAVTYDSIKLDGVWTITGYPLEEINVCVDGGIATSDLKKGAVMFEGRFTLPEGQRPLDTFLNTIGWGRGYVWINGRNLGRYWPGVGPQVTLYVPGVWLNAAPDPNRLQILELENAPIEYTMEFLDYPILNVTRTGTYKLIYSRYVSVIIAILVIYAMVFVSYSFGQLLVFVLNNSIN